jgi:uncharacterized Tic20 family protein
MSNPAANSAAGPAQPGSTRLDDAMFEPTALPWERTYATFEHLSALSAFLGLPIVPTLVMWLIKKNESGFAGDHGKESLNFQISVAIYYLIALLLTSTGIGACIGMPMFIGIAVLALIGVILSSVAANQGRYYRYPMCLRLIA